MVAFYLKVNHLIVDHNFKAYVEYFLNKSIKVEYYVDKVVKIDIGIDLKPLENHNLLKLIGLSKRYVPCDVKALYYFMKKNSYGIES